MIFQLIKLKIVIFILIINQIYSFLFLAFSKDTLNDIIFDLESQNTEWSKKILSILKSMSPTSLNGNLLIHLSNSFFIHFF